MVRVRVGALIFSEGKVLLAKHLKKGKIYYVLPGGHLEEDETIFGCVKRELFEEGNIVVEPKMLLSVLDIFKDSGVHVVEMCVYAEHVSGELKLGSDPEDKGEKRLQGIGYFSKDEFFRLTFFPVELKEKIVEVWDNTDKISSDCYIG